MFPVFLGMSIFSDIFCFMFLCGFGRRWVGFVPFGTWRLTEEGVSYLLQQQCGYFSDVDGVD